jgi:tRNA threonylcarbamoyladenosine biosynthesis protein TsaB
MQELSSGRARRRAAARWGSILLLLLAAGCAQKTTTVRPDRPREEGEASWYGPGLYGKKTASGEVLRPGGLTAAHRTLPFGTCLRVTNLGNGRVVEVRVNDRGPYAANRIIDVSEAAARILGMVGTGVARVRLDPCSGHSSLDETPAPGSVPLASAAWSAQSTRPGMILALDSSTLTLSLAVGSPGEAEPLAAARHGPPSKMSDLLPGAVQELLGGAGLTLGDVQGLVVGLGPGSFTGLRIGLATVKGLAYARRLPVAGASSLAALALEGPADVPLAVVAVARRGELYLGRYLRSGKRVQALAPEEAVPEAELARWLAAEPSARVLGPAVHEAPEALRAAGVPDALLLTMPDIPSAWALSALAAVPPAFDLQALAALEPHYVRASEAERNPKFPPLPGPAPAARIRGEES